jgi:hypothetical protein
MKILEVQGGYLPGSNIWFKKANGNEIRGTFVINPLDPTILSVSLDADTYPGNTDIVGVDTRGTIDAIIDPYKYNPLEVYGNYAGIPLGIRFLMLDDVSETTLNGAASWKNVDGSNNAISVNSIIEWNGTEWATVWDPLEAESDTYIQNIRTGIKYRWDGTQWLKAFEGEYRPGDWNFNLIG